MLHLHNTMTELHYTVACLEWWRPRLSLKDVRVGRGLRERGVLMLQCSLRHQLVLVGQAVQRGLDLERDGMVRRVHAPDSPGCAQVANHLRAGIQKASFVALARMLHMQGSCYSRCKILIWHVHK